MLEEDAHVGAGEKVAGGKGRDAGLGGPLDEAVHEGGRELADGDGSVFDFDLAGEDGEGGRGLAVGGAEEETAEDDAVLHVDPDKAAAAQVGATPAGDEDVAVVANLDGDAGAGEDLVEGIGKGHVASVMEHAVRDVGAEDVAELAVAVKITGGRAAELGEEGEGRSRDRVQEQSFVKGRRRRERGGRRLGRRLGPLVVWRWGRRFLGGRSFGGGDGLRGGAREVEGCGEDDDRQKDGKAAEGRAKRRHGARSLPLTSP